MYGYRDITFPITKEAILSLVKQEHIFEMVLGYIPKEYVYVKSPFRQDNNPDCYFEWHGGKLYFVDWTISSKRRHRDCFNAIQDRLSLNFHDTLQYINNHFKLGLAQGFTPEINIANIVGEDKVKSNKKTAITFKARPFNNNKDREFWSRYGISKDNLIEDNVFPIIWYKVFSKKLKTHVIIRPYTRTYSIARIGGRFKIYTPDIVGKGKWITNCTQDDIGALDKLATMGDILVISKSYKDCRVLRNKGLHSIWFQNEGMIPKREILIPILRRFKKVFIFFDNDRTGIRSANKLSLLINTILPDKTFVITLPVELLDEGIKDPSDLIHKKGEAHLTEFLMVNSLIK